MAKIDSHPPVQISKVRFVSASHEEVATGLMGYVGCVLNGTLRLDGITLRRAAVDGHLLLSFPAKKDSAGREHFYLRPENDDVRCEIEAQVFQALGFNASGP